MPDSLQITYWDANVFLAYVNEEAERMPTLDAILDMAARGGIQLHTSEVSRAEVAFGAAEQIQQALDPETERLIDNLWNNQAVVVMVEYHAEIGNRARTLMREAITRGWSLKPLDTIHLATAQWLTDNGVQVGEFQTYDRGLDKYAALVGFKVCEPYTANPRMI